VDLEWKRERRGWILRIFIDKPTGITVEDCAKVSSLVGKILDEEDFIHHSYTLEVSSPGIERPLTKKEHFERFAGEKAKITLKNPVEGRKNFTGLLLGVKEGDLVVIEVEGKTWEFPLTEIKKARLQPEIKF
jgi:ribosome maturation factor RimP